MEWFLIEAAGIASAPEMIWLFTIISPTAGGRAKFFGRSPKSLNNFISSNKTNYKFHQMTFDLGEIRMNQICCEILWLVTENRLFVGTYLNIS